MNAFSSRRSSSVRSSKAKSMSSLLEGRQAPRDQRCKQCTDVLESLTHGLVVDEPVVNAFEDHRDLEVPECDVPVQRGQICAALGGVPVEQLGGLREAVLGADSLGDRVLLDSVEPFPIDHQQA